jgi:hypothetical protein
MPSRGLPTDRTRRALLAGPWCWPPADTIAHAAQVAALGDPPLPRAGHVAAVTVRQQTTTLWHVHTSTTDRRSTPLGPEARASWHAAGLALPRSLPVLWRSVHDATRDAPGVHALRARLAAPGFEQRDPFVDGPSFGLSFFLLLASAVLDCPVPGDVIATASIDALGVLGRVDALPLKIAGILDLAPAVTRLVVSADQHDEALALAHGRLQVVPARNAAEALEHVFGTQLARLLVDAGSSPARRQELTASFFQLALVGRGASVDWSPVARGADQALREWHELDEAGRYQLVFARAVAARHERNEGELPLPPPEWLDRQPRPLRLQVLAHLVQQAADTGSPDAGAVEALAGSERVEPLSQAFLPQLKLHGALCRLWAVTGRAALALRDQERLAHACANIYADHEVSFPLVEWLRLAGALRDAAAFDRAQAFRHEMLTRGGFGAHGGPYIELAAARGRLLLAGQDQEARLAASRVADDVSVPTHVRWSAHRWAGQLRARSLEEAARSQPEAHRYHVLAQLDRALHDGDHTAATALVAALAELDPGPTGHLRRTGADAAVIARLYPY